MPKRKTKCTFQLKTFWIEIILDLCTLVWTDTLPSSIWETGIAHMVILNAQITNTLYTVRKTVGTNKKKSFFILKHLNICESNNQMTISVKLYCPKIIVRNVLLSIYFLNSAATKFFKSTSVHSSLWWKIDVFVKHFKH